MRTVEHGLHHCVVDISYCSSDILQQMVAAITCFAPTSAQAIVFVVSSGTVVQIYRIQTIITTSRVPLCHARPSSIWLADVIPIISRVMWSANVTREQPHGQWTRHVPCFRDMTCSASAVNEVTLMRIQGKTFTAKSWAKSSKAIFSAVGMPWELLLDCHNTV